MSKHRQADVRFTHKTNPKKSFTVPAKTIHPKLRNLSEDTPIPTIWVGGPEGKEMDKLVETYRKFGIEIVDVWGTVNQALCKKNFPSNVKLIIYNSELIKHSVINHIKKLAKKAETPWVCGFTGVMHTLKAASQQVPIRTLDQETAEQLNKAESSTQREPQNQPLQKKSEEEKPVVQPQLKVVSENDSKYLARLKKAAVAFAGREGDADLLLDFIRPEMERGSPRILRLLESQAPNEEYVLNNDWILALFPSNEESTGQAFTYKTTEELDNSVTLLNLVSPKFKGTRWLNDYTTAIDSSHGLGQKIAWRAAALGYIKRAEPYTDGMVRRGEPTLTLMWTVTPKLITDARRVLVKRLSARQSAEKKRKKTTQKTTKPQPKVAKPEPRPSHRPEPVEKAETQEQQTSLVHPDLSYLTPNNQENVLDALRLLHGYLKDCENATYHQIKLNVETGEVEVDVTRKTKHTFKL